MHTTAWLFCPIIAKTPNALEANLLYPVLYFCITF